MLVAFFTLLLMYVGLALLHALQRPTPPGPWPPLVAGPKPPPVPEASGPCRAHDDCPPSHACLAGSCAPRLRPGGNCDPATGDWFAFRGFAACACKDHRLFTQRLFGGECDVPAACGLRGTYDVRKGSCVCEPGYEASGLECRRKPALLATPSCAPPDEVEVSRIAPADGFHPDYAETRLRPSARCARRPCTFDALTGRPLLHAEHVPGWGCVCDPRYGLFGVVLRGAGKKYLSSEGFDACAGIFEREPREPSSVEHVTYFYLGEREPVSVVAFDAAGKEEKLAPVFRGRGGRFSIRQSPWRYDFAQHFFRTRPRFRARIRRARRLNALDLQEVVDDHLFDESFEPPDCETLKHASRGTQPAPIDEAYRLLYENPVCRTTDSGRVDPALRHRVVLNPNFYVYDEHPELPRFNAAVLRYDAEGLKEWTLDVDREYDADRFRRDVSNVPVY